MSAEDRTLIVSRQGEITGLMIYVDHNNSQQETRTNQILINEVTYFIPMHTLIDDRSLKNDPQMNCLFLSPRTPADPQKSATPVPSGSAALPRRRGQINRLKEGYGFVTDSVDGKSRFFHHTSLQGELFNNLREGDEVEFEPIEDGKNGKALNLTLGKP